MAGSLTQFGEKLLLNYSIGKAPSGDDATVAPSGNMFAGLATGVTSGSLETGASMVFTELAGYSRVELDSANWSSYDTGSTASKLTYTEQVTFTYTGTTGVVAKYLLLYPKAGTTVSSVAVPAIWYSELTNGSQIGRSLTYGDVIIIPANSIVLTLD